MLRAQKTNCFGLHYIRSSLMKQNMRKKIYFGDWVDYDKVEHFVEFSNEGVVNGGIKVRRIQRQIENANDCKIIII